jgi:anti-sigma factor RsiW
MSKKSDCKFKEKINAYLDNELNETEFLQVKNHLLTCSICQAEVREINQLNNFLEKYQEEEVPDSITNDILAAVSEVSETYFIRKNRFIKYTAAASIAASFIIGLLFSSLIFPNNNDSLAEYSLGQESLYSYYVTE